MKRKILGAVLTLFLILSNALPAFAATFHILTTGGQRFENVATVSDDYISHLVNIRTPGYDLNNTTFTGTGWQAGTYDNTNVTPTSQVPCIYKVSSGSKTENLKVKYPNYLTIGSKKYDVVLDITGTETEATSAAYEMPKTVPGISYNFPITNGWTPTKQNADTEVGWTLHIYEPGTTTPANIKNLHLQLSDLDRSNYSTGGYSVEALRINGFSANSSNTWIKQEASGRGMVNSGSFYGLETSNNDINAWIKTTSETSGYYGARLTGEASMLPRFGATFSFFVTKHNVYYNTDGKGSVSLGSEKKFADENPTGSVDTPNSGYYLDYWTVDKSVDLTDGTTIPAGGRITEAQIKNVLVNSDITFTAHHAPYLKVSYEWVGPHPGHNVPGGKTDIKSGDEYDVDTSFVLGQTEKGTKDGQKGTWTFEGWDKNGTLEIVEDTVIKGTWSFVPEYDITTDAINGTITETETDIPEGQNRVITYSPNEGYQLLSLTVDGESKDPKEYPASYTFNDIHADHDVKVVYEKIPALAIEKTADKEIYNAGDTVTYTIKVSQTVDGAEARNVTVKDVLPEGLTLNKDSFSEGVTVVKAEDNEYELTIPSIETEFTYTYTAGTAIDADAEELINVAEATAENVPGDPAKDDASIKSLQPKPEITKVVSNENPIEGEEITYTISIKEPQDGITLRNAVLTDPIPEGVEAIGELAVIGDGAEATLDGNTLTVIVPELSEEVVISFKAIVKASTGSVDNVATLTGDNVDPVTDNAVIEIKEPTPKLIKTVSKENVSIGDTVTYTIVASSDIPLKDAVITDKLPENIELEEGSVKTDKEAEISISEGIISIKVKSLDEPLNISYNAKIKAEGEHVNIASLMASNFPKGPLEATAKVLAAKPKASIEKTVSKDEVVDGEVVTYQIVAKAEEGTIYDAVISDKLPKGVTLDKNSVSVSDEAKVSVSDSEIKVAAETLGEITISYKAAVKEGSHTNTATLNGSNIEETSDSATVKATKKPVEEEPVKEKAPKLTKTVSKENVKVGDIITYTIKATTDDTLKDVEIKDTLPKGVESTGNYTVEMDGKIVEKNSNISLNGNAFTAKFPEVAKEVVIKIEAKVVETGKIVNTANMTAKDIEPLSDSATIRATKDATSNVSKTNESRSNSPKTGDNTPIMAFIGLLAIAGCSSAVIIYRRRKEK